jgi:hypothetical protein
VGKTRKSIVGGRYACDKRKIKDKWRGKLRRGGGKLAGDLPRSVSLKVFSINVTP